MAGSDPVCGTQGDQATERGKPFGGLALERRGKQIRLGARRFRNAERAGPGRSRQSYLQMQNTY